MRRQHALAVIAVLAMALSACGSSDAGTSSGKSTAAKAVSDQDKARQFAQCMRTNGIDMPDPEVDGEGRITFGDSGALQGLAKQRSANQEKFTAALDKCRRYLPNGGENLGQLSQEDQDELLKYARCMREHGINMPDPDPESGGMAQGLGDVDIDSPKFKEANKACQQYAPNRLRRLGGGS